MSTFKEYLQKGVWIFFICVYCPEIKHMFVLAKFLLKLHVKGIYFL